MTSRLYEHVKDGSVGELQILGIDLDEQLIERAKENNKYPENIQYQRANIMNELDGIESVLQNYLESHNFKYFNIICCFSVTMWIHVNHGDEKFKEFLKYISSMAKYIIMEPQPYKCYRNASRRMRKLKCATFPHMDDIEWKINVDKKIDEYLKQECELDCVKHLGTTDWDRYINVYVNPVLSLS